MAAKSASTQSQKPRSSHTDFSTSGYLAPTLLPSCSGAKAADAPSCRTCTVATSMGNFPAAFAPELSAQEHPQDNPFHFQQTSRPWQATPTSPTVGRYDDERVPSSLTSPINIGRMVSISSAVATPHGPQATFLSEADSRSPYTDVSVPDTVGSESRSAVVHSWLEHHSGSSGMQGPEACDPLLSDDGVSDVPHSASLDTFLQQEVPLKEKIHSSNMHHMQHHFSGVISPHQRSSLSIFDSPQERSTHVGATLEDATAAGPQTDTEIPKIERWLRAVGKARGWDLGLLDDLLTQNLAAVLANDTTIGVQGAEDANCYAHENSQLRISQMNPRSNPIALQVCLCGILGANDSTQKLMP